MSAICANGGPAGRQLVDELAIDDALPRHALDVDDRRLAGDRDGLLDGPDAQLGVDGSP
jgi:hypothetical protein